MREALIEREVLLKAAPHIIWPLRFVLPHHKGLRPRPLIRLGLFLYDHLGGRKILPPTRSIDLHSDVTGEPLKPEFAYAYEYSDCWVEDARLVVLNARDAANRGAEIRTRTKCTKAKRIAGGWELTITPDGGEPEVIRARALINAAGPWVSAVLGDVVGRKDPDKIRMVKGSHIVVDKLFDHDRCYIFQNGDGRICFAIPYEQNFTLIGTTDEDHTGEPSSPHVTDGEIDYLLSAVSEYFKLQVTREQLRWSYAGIRPLYDDGASKAQEATRDYVLKLDAPAGKAPLLSVFGGKITTFRKLAESVLEKIAPFFANAGKPWTAGVALPGGDFPFDEVEMRISELQRKYSFFAPQNVRRIFRAYGTNAEKMFDNARFAKDMGKSFGPLSEREINYLMAQEWVREADDILWRRSKLGLHLSAEEQQALREHMKPAVKQKSTKRAKG